MTVTSLMPVPDGAVAVIWLALSALKLAAGVPQYQPLKRIDVGGEVLESPEQGAKVFSFHEVEGTKPLYLGGYAGANYRAPAQAGR